MEKKQIWVINQFAGTLDSGWGERHYFLAEEWVKKGYDVSIISGSFNHLFRNQPQISKKRFTVERIEPGICFCWVRIPKYAPESNWRLFTMLLFSFRLLFLSTKKLKRPDTIIISSMPIFSVLPAYILSRKFKSKFIFEVRDLWPQTPIHLKGYSKYHPVVRFISWFETFGFKKAESIVSLLPNAGAYINEISGNPEKLHYIPNGIKIKNHESVDVPNEIESRVPDGKFVIGYAGTLGLANAMEFFIEAAIKLKADDRFHFLVLGDGYLKTSFQNETKGLKNISFLGKVPKNEVASILGLFDICYLGRYNSPLYKHGVSYNKYFDYMLAKKPILESSDFIKDQVELSGCGLIVEPENSDAIIDGINELYKMSSNDLVLMGQKGYDYCLKHHSYSYLAKRYVNLFRDKNYV